MEDGIDIESLSEEVRRYLDAVELFRKQGCEPNWQPELAPEERRLAVLLAAYDKRAYQAAS